MARFLTFLFLSWYILVYLSNILQIGVENIDLNDVLDLCVFKVSRNNPNSVRDEKKINSFVQIILNIFLHVCRILSPYGYKKRQEDTNKIWVSKKLVSRETKKQFYLPSGLENNFITLKSKVRYSQMGSLNQIPNNWVLCRSKHKQVSYYPWEYERCVYCLNI